MYFCRLRYTQNIVSVCKDDLIKDWPYELNSVLNRSSHQSMEGLQRSDSTQFSLEIPFNIPSQIRAAQRVQRNRTPATYVATHILGTWHNQAADHVVWLRKKSRKPPDAFIIISDFVCNSCRSTQPSQLVKIMAKRQDGRLSEVELYVAPPVPSPSTVASWQRDFYSECQPVAPPGLGEGMLSARLQTGSTGQLLITERSWFWIGAAEGRFPGRKMNMVTSPTADSVVRSPEMLLSQFWNTFFFFLTKLQLRPHQKI